MKFELNPISETEDIANSLAMEGMELTDEFKMKILQILKSEISSEDVRKEILNNTIR